MNNKTIGHYFLSCFLLTLPVLVWNIVFANKLPLAFQPAMFWMNIPSGFALLENVSRIFIFVITLLMPLHVTSSLQKKGLALYLIGLILYFASWAAIIIFPDSDWSKSLPGFMAPAFTPAFWLLGIVMLGDSFFFKLPYSRWIPASVASIFLMLHNAHTLVVYLRFQAAFGGS